MTQIECEAEWIKLKSEIRERIRLIDKETPATDGEPIRSTIEPQWWLQMMETLKTVA